MFTIYNIKLTDIDLDSKSFMLAQNQNIKLKVPNVKFTQSEPWKIKNNKEFDIITSNGLNVYEQDD